MLGMICMVTGATSGIGKITALELARKGATIALVGRNPARTTMVVEAIRNETGNPNVEPFLADLSSQAQIRQLASTFLAQHDHLDVLVNNAGGFFLKRYETVDGLELTFALNHLNYFLLTNLLLEALHTSPSARIVNVSSDAHQGGRINFDDLQSRRHFFGWTAYAQSKLANILFTYELARRLGSVQITANALHPGFVASNFAKNNGFLVKYAMRLVQFSAISPEEGAKTSVYLASSPDVEGITGKYFVRQKPEPSSAVSYNTDTARRLWDVSRQLTGI